MYSQEFQRLLDFLESSPQHREQLRQQLLSAELLALPENFARLVQTVDKLSATTAQLVQSVDGLSATTARMNDRIEDIDGRFVDLQATTAQMNDRLGDIDGRTLELKATSNIDKISAQELNLRRSHVLKAAGQNRSPELDQALDAAVIAGQITEDQGDSLLLADIILRARRRDSREQVHVVFEVSRTINRHDIERARDRAATLEVVTGQAVIPAVLGQVIDPRQREQANQLGVAVIIPTNLGG